MTPLWWMFLGYSLMFLVIVIYVGNLGRRQAALHRELLALHAAVDAGLAAEGEQAETGDAAERTPQGR